MHFKKQPYNINIQYSRSRPCFHENLNFRDCCQRYFLSWKPQDKPQATRSLFFAELLLLYGQSILIRTAIQLFPGYLTVKKNPTVYQLPTHRKNTSVTECGNDVVLNS